MACSADGHYRAIADGILQLPGNAITSVVDSPGLVTISSMTDDQPEVSFLGHNDSITQITFANDNRHVASASLDGTVKVWRISTDREGHTLTGHPAGLDHVKYSGDGQHMATGGGGQVRVWDLATGRTILALRGRGDWAFSRRGTRIALVEDDNHLMVRDAVDGRVIHAIQEQDKISGPSFSPDGRRLAVIVAKPYDLYDLKGKPASINVWDVDGRRQVQTFTLNLRRVRQIDFSHDSRLLAVSTGDSLPTEEPGQAFIWDLASGRQVFDRRSHPGGIYVLAFSPDDKRVVTAGRDAVATVWDIEMAQELLSLRGHTKSIGEIIFGPDGRTMVTRSSDGTRRLWDVRTGQQILILRGSPWSGFVSYSPDGKRLITEGLGNLSDSSERLRQVVLWDAASGQELVTLRGFSSGTVSATFTPDGKRLVSAAGDGKIKIWDVRPAREQDDLASGRETVGKASQAPAHGQPSGRGSFTLWGHEDAVNGVVFSPDGDRLASASDDGTVKIWNAAGEEVRTVRGHWSKVFAVAFSHDGTRIASAGDDGTVRVWDAETGAARLTIRGHGGAVSCVEFDPDDKAIASCGADKTVWVWDATSGREVYHLTGHSNPVMGLSFSADGTRIASAGGDPAVKIWDLTTGREERTLWENHGFVKAQYARRTLPAGVSYSRDGTWVASANSGDAIMIWDSRTGRLARTLTGHGGRITDVEFAPGGRQIASAYEDGTLGLWEIESGKEVRTLKGHTNKVTGLSYSPDGTRIASSSLDGTIEIWEVAADPIAPRVTTKDLRALREARGVLELLFAQKLPVPEIVARIRRDTAMRADVRECALGLAESYVQARAADEADRLVSSLFAKLVSKNDVVESLRGDTALSEAVRRKALSLAEGRPDDGPKNLGFEEGLEGWESYISGARPTIDFDAGVVREGRQSLRVTATELSDTAFGQEVMLKPGHPYRLSGWVRTRGLDPHGSPVYGTFQVQHTKGHDPSLIAKGTNHGGDTEWTEVAITFQAPASGRTRICAFFVGFGKGTGAAWFDDLKLVEVNASPR